MDLYSYSGALQTLPPLSLSAVDNDDLDPGGNCSKAKCVPPAGVALTIISSVASIVGSLLIICTFLRWKDLRTIARMILVFLAISDLLAGIGYVFGAAIYIHYYYIDGYCYSNSSGNSSIMNPANVTSYEYLCEIQSFFTTIMPMSSFLWTANLALYLFFSVLWPKIKFTKILMIFFHVTAWGIPLVTCVTILATGYFGASESRSSGGWCWIKYKDYGDRRNYYAAELMAGKIWEIGVCVLALFVCIAIKVVGAKRFKKSKVSCIVEVLLVGKEVSERILPQYRVPGQGKLFGYPFLLLLLLFCFWVALNSVAAGILEEVCSKTCLHFLSQVEDLSCIHTGKYSAPFVKFES